MLRLIGWNCVVFAGLALIIELTFGYWFWGDPLHGLNIFRDVTWKYDANHLYRRAEPVIYRRDKWGFRGHYGEVSDIDVLVLGGSTTDQRFISEGETWPDVLSQCLGARGLPAGVANAGVTGQSARGFVANMDLWLSRIPNLKPKHVLVFLGINEIWGDREQFAYRNDPRTFNEHASTSSAWAIYLQRAKMMSAFYRLFRTVNGMWTAYRAGIAYSTDTNPKVSGVDKMAQTMAARRNRSESRIDLAFQNAFADVQRRMARPVDAYRQNLKQLFRHVRQMGARPVLVTQTWATYDVQGDIIYGNAHRYRHQETINQVTRDACRRTNASCIDMAADFSYRPGDTYDVIHSTPQGARRIGEYICNGFAKLLTADP